MTDTRNSRSPEAEQSLLHAYQAVHQHFFPLYSDLQPEAHYPHRRPLLAHYTSIEALERVLVTNELWFSNPLFMNDVEEIRFGINEGMHHFLNSPLVKEACGSDKRATALFDAFDHYYLQFANEHVLDVFVLCWSEHTPNDTDGLLSMWRGYGGNGKGIALVIDTSKMTPVDGSPLVLSHVVYESSEGRREWLVQKVSEFAGLLKEAALPDGQIHLAAWVMFERIKLFSLFSKHRGFSEEREWRVVYLKERDVHKRLESMCHYAIGPRGVEPKLKLKLEPIDGVMPQGFSLTELIHQIILGPSVSTPLAKAAVLRMLDNIGKPELKAKVVASNIPFRPGGL